MAKDVFDEVVKAALTVVMQHEDGVDNSGAIRRLTHTLLDAGYLRVKPTAQPTEMEMKRTNDQV